MAAAEPFVHVCVPTTGQDFEGHNTQGACFVANSYFVPTSRDSEKFYGVLHSVELYTVLATYRFENLDFMEGESMHENIMVTTLGRFDGSGAATSPICEANSEDITATTLGCFGGSGTAARPDFEANSEFEDNMATTLGCTDGSGAAARPVFGANSEDEYIMATKLGCSDGSSASPSRWSPPGRERHSEDEYIMATTLGCMDSPGTAAHPREVNSENYRFNISAKDYCHMVTIPNSFKQFGAATNSDAACVSVNSENSDLRECSGHYNFSDFKQQQSPRRGMNVRQRAGLPLPLLQVHELHTHSTVSPAPPSRSHQPT